MPIRAERKALYPANWKAISLRVREDANWKCEWCPAEQGKPNPVTGSKVVLTVAHMNHDETDCRPGNLRALCQRCHLRYDAEYHQRNASETRAKRAAKAKSPQEAVPVVQVNFKVSEVLAHTISVAAAKEGSTRRLIARLMREAGYDVPEIDVSPPDNRQRAAARRAFVSLHS